MTGSRRAALFCRLANTRNTVGKICPKVGLFLSDFGCSLPGSSHRKIWTLRIGYTKTGHWTAFLGCPENGELPGGSQGTGQNSGTLPALSLRTRGTSEKFGWIPDIAGCFPAHRGEILDIFWWRSGEISDIAGGFQRRCREDSRVLQNAFFRKVGGKIGQKLDNPGGFQGKLRADSRPIIPGLTPNSSTTPGPVLAALGSNFPAIVLTFVSSSRHFAAHFVRDFPLFYPIPLVRGLSISAVLRPFRATTFLRPPGMRVEVFLEDSLVPRPSLLFPGLEGLNSPLFPGHSLVFSVPPGTTIL